MTSYGVFLLRVIAGFGLSALFGFASLMFARVLFRFVIGDLVLGGYLWAGDVYVIALFSGIGAAAGAGTVLGWIGSDIAPQLRSPYALGWLLLGAAAAWAAYGYKTIIDPYATYEHNVVSQTAVLWAVLAPNIAASVIGIYKQWRTGWM